MQLSFLHFIDHAEAINIRPSPSLCRSLDFRGQFCIWNMIRWKLQRITKWIRIPSNSLVYRNLDQSYCVVITTNDYNLMTYKGKNLWDKKSFDVNIRSYIHICIFKWASKAHIMLPMNVPFTVITAYMHQPIKMLYCCSDVWSNELPFSGITT